MHKKKKPQKHYIPYKMVKKNSANYARPKRTTTPPIQTPRRTHGKPHKHNTKA